MEATLNVMLLTLTTAVFCDNDMYVVTLTRSMVLECVNFKGLQDSLRFPVLLAKNLSLRECQKWKHEHTKQHHIEEMLLLNAIYTHQTPC
jgi:hypothetical protein